MASSPGLDAHALLVYLEREERFETVKRSLSRCLDSGEPLPMTVVNLGEVPYIVRREQGAERSTQVEAVVGTLPIEVVDVDLELTREAARLKAGGGLSFADCFAAALASQRRTALLTGDPEFESVAGQIRVEWLWRA